MGSTPPGGAQAGRYILKSRMARGGMGEVFRAVAIDGGGAAQPVVIKRILPIDAGRGDLAELFVAEARIMTRLVHPNIVQVLDFGLGEDGDYYLVLELVDGVDLGRLCRSLRDRGEALPVPVALFVAGEVLRGLGHAHARSAEEGQLLVHRDVSLGNVLLSTEGEVKLAELGVALATRDEDEPTGPLQLVGKPRYMAPEQFDGEPVDARADVFSVGVVLFEMLTGAPPFEGSSADERMAAARAGRSLRGADLRPEVSEALEAVLARALSPRREDRFADGRAMASAVERLRDAGQPVATPADLAAFVAAYRQGLSDEASAGQPAPDAPPEEDLEGTELRRTEAGGPFTRWSVDPAGEAADIGLAEGAGGGSERPPRRGRGSSSAPPNAALGDEVLGGGDVDPIARGDPPPSGAGDARQAGGPDGTSPGRGRAPGRIAAVALGVAAVTALALAALRTDGIAEGPATGPGRAPAAALPSTAGPGEVTPAAMPAVAPDPTAGSATPAPGCEGEVQLTAAQGWIVSGGPTIVQAPGRYRWPCGDFSLQATSSADPAQTRHATVKVRAGATEVVDLP